MSVTLWERRVSGLGEEVRDPQLTATISQAGPCFCILPPPAKHASELWRGTRCHPPEKKPRNVPAVGIQPLLRGKSIQLSFWDWTLLLETERRGRPSWSGSGLDRGRTGHRLLPCVAVGVSRLCKLNPNLLLGLPLFFLLCCKSDGSESLVHQLTV